MSTASHVHGLSQQGKGQRRCSQANEYRRHQLSADDEQPLSYLYIEVEKTEFRTIVIYLTKLDPAMAYSVNDVTSLSQARAKLSELSEVAEQGKAGAEKIITKNGESYVARIDAQQLDHFHRLERAHIHLQLLDEASKGLDDIAAGRVVDAATALRAIKTSG